MEKSLLMTIVKKQNLWNIIDYIKRNNSSTDRVMVLKTEDKQHSDYFYLIYDAILKDSSKIRNTIIVHRKMNTIFTINSLNKIVNNLCGSTDKQYQLDWDNEKYKNKLFLTTKEGQLLQIDTIKYKDINLRKTIRQ